MIFALTLAFMPIHAAVQIAANGTAACVIARQPGATPAERYAAEELAATLTQITGTTFEVRELGEDAPASVILVGRDHWRPSCSRKRDFPNWAARSM